LPELPRTFYRFVDLMTSRPERFQLQAAMEDVAHVFDLQMFAYLLMPQRPDRRAGLISNYPSAWTTFYLDHRYQELDPVILRASKQTLPFIWGPGVLAKNQSTVEEQFFNEAAQFGLRHGLTIPIHDDPNTIAAVTFAADCHLVAFDQCLDAQLPLLQLIAVFFHRYARRILRPEQSIGGVTLTPRELECLNWAAQGKSAWEIGQILRISRRTAGFHLDNARRKLGVSTVKQAIARFAAANPVL
jgi:LuxR family transcriptional activator of conjugal transfer of Ti plasmids